MRSLDKLWVMTASPIAWRFGPSAASLPDSTATQMVPLYDGVTLQCLKGGTAPSGGRRPLTRSRTNARSPFSRFPTVLFLAIHWAKHCSNL